MNSFFVPALAGQIYAMPGMETKLHAVINKPGVYDGFSANYSGAGFSDMRFKFHGLSAADFDAWVQQAKAGGDDARPHGLPGTARSRASATRCAATRSVAPGLYDAILNRCVEAGKMCMNDMMAIDAAAAAAAVAWRTTPAALQPTPPAGQAAMCASSAAICTADDPAGPSTHAPIP